MRKFENKEQECLHVTGVGYAWCTGFFAFLLVLAIAGDEPATGAIFVILGLWVLAMAVVKAVVDGMYGYWEPSYESEEEYDRRKQWSEDHDLGNIGSNSYWGADIYDLGD